MSQSTAVRVPARHARTAPRPTPAPSRLRVVAAPAHTRSRFGGVIAAGLLLVAGLVTLLLLQMSLERGAYALADQQKTARELTAQQQQLQEELEQLQAPQNLAASAEKLGMVRADNPAFLRASDGKVLGVPAPGVAKPSPTVKKAPAAKAAPSAAPAKGAAKTTAPAKKPAATSTKAAATGTKAPSATKKTPRATSTTKATTTQ